MNKIIVSFMEDVEKIYYVIKNLCSSISEADEAGKPTIEIPRGATGSAAGLPFENWFKESLSGKVDYEVFERLEFIRYVDKNYLRKKSVNLNELRKNVWWWEPQQLSEKVIERIRMGERPKLQQALGDIIVKYGEGLNDIVLINVKATEVGRDGKPIGRQPNIVSALRLLNFLVDIFTEKIILKNKINIWLVGFHYLPKEENKVQIRNAYFKDLFKLDLERAPPINFDAANQIQWHLNEMVENQNQTLEDFAIKLGEKYLKEWKEFMKRRDEKVEKIVKKLKDAIRKHASSK